MKMVSADPVAMHVQEVTDETLPGYAFEGRTTSSISKREKLNYILAVVFIASAVVLAFLPKNILL